MRINNFDLIRLLAALQVVFALKITPAALALRLPVVVSATAYLTHHTHRYSMPPDALGFAGTLYRYRAAATVVACRRLTPHARHDAAA